MINPVTIMKMFNERHQFIKNHPDLYPFLKAHFGSGIETGSVIELKVSRPGEIDEEILRMEVQESEMPLFRAVQDILK